MLKEIQKAVDLFKESFSKQDTICYILTGAGISKASNIPTFRGEDGLWEKYNFEEVATFQAWKKNPQKLWGLYQEGVGVIFDAKPNEAHYAISKLEENKMCQYVITQNIDSLHQRAGSKKIIELHGNISRIKCSKCRKSYILDGPPKEVPPLCSCGSILRPDVVFFGESLPEKEIREAFQIAEKADIVLVVGTSAEVVPAASLPYISKRKGAKVFVFNPEKTDHANIADVFIQGKCEELLPIFVEELIKQFEK
ncbi:MAG: NAD-dependent protein deacylase [Candidatus Thorarchaeota archaeon]